MAELPFFFVLFPSYMWRHFWLLLPQVHWQLAPTETDTDASAELTENGSIWTGVSLRWRCSSQLYHAQKKRT